MFSSLLSSLNDAVPSDRKPVGWIFLVLLLLGFVGAGLVGIDRHPSPWQDEAWLMQPGHELATTGRLGLPMFRIRGNNLETKVFDAPVFYVESAAWYRLFGFGLGSARTFNLTLAALALVLVYTFARRTIGVAGALLGIALVATDGSFFETARTFRNDMPALCHVWLAIVLYAWAENREATGWRHGLVGIAAGLAVQTHLNGLYLWGVLGLWLLMEHGPALWRKRPVWMLAAGVAVSFVPFFLYCLTDWSSFIGQWTKTTPGRYAALQGGLIDNVFREWRRYYGWGANMLGDGVGQGRIWFTWLLMLTPVAILTVALGAALRDREARETARRAPWARIVVATLFVAVFFTVLDEPKSPSYIPHIAVWYGLSCGVVTQALWKKHVISTGALWKSPAAAILLLVPIYGIWTGLTFIQYLRGLHPAAIAPYAELAGVLRAAVPDDLTPVAYPTHWLAFTDDRRFLACKSRFWRKLPGKDYAFIIDEKGIASNSRKFPRWLRENAPNFHLLARLENTAYGTILIYYTGTDARWTGLPAQAYRFNGRAPGFTRLPDASGTVPEFESKPDGADESDDSSDDE